MATSVCRQNYSKMILLNTKALRAVQWYFPSQKWYAIILISVNRLGRAYFETFIKDDRRDDRKLYFSAASYFRGIQLFRSVEKTVSSFAKEKNLATREKVEKEVESLNLKPEISNKIFDHVAKYLKMDEPEEIVEAEFEDLGKSARLKLIEESFRKLDAAEDVDERSVVSLASLAGFEQKMFHFLDEI